MTKSSFLLLSLLLLGSLRAEEGDLEVLTTEIVRLEYRATPGKRMGFARVYGEALRSSIITQLRK